MVVSLLALATTESIVHSLRPTPRRIVLEPLGCYPSQTTMKRRHDRLVVSG